jgi:uncharacterized protein (DUF1697 family)
LPALKACFEAQGFHGVGTYIQSGNVLFTSGRANPHVLMLQIEKTLSKTFAYQARVVVRSFELRLKGKAGIARALYVTAKEQRVVIVRAFIKKTEKTPAGEIVLALERAKEVKP